MPALRVLIVGASIAGPTAAYWFSRAGATVTVIERFSILRTGGHNIDIRTSGVTVMRRMPGLESAVRRNRMRLDGLCLVRDDGRPYGTIRKSHSLDQQSLLSEYEIFRGELSKCLYDISKSRRDVEYRFGEQVKVLDERDDGVQVEFSSGRKQEFDLVVGCDGAASRTRQIMFANESLEKKDQYRQSTGSWAAYFSIKDVLNTRFRAEKIGYGHSSVPGRFLSIEPKSEGENIVQMISLGNDLEQMAKFRAANMAGQEALRQFLLEAFAGHAWKTDEVLQAMQSCDDLYASEITIVKVPHLSKGRFVLVGDAGCAPGFAGTGTTLALTGAYIVAGEILSSRGDIFGALEKYDRIMKPLIKKLTWIPPFVPGVMAPQSAIGLRLRNSIFAMLAWSRLLEYAQRFSGSSGGKVDDYPVPEYKWLE